MSGIQAKVNSNGELVIPENVTSSLDWLPGAEVSFSIEDNRLVATKYQERAVPHFYALAMRCLERMKSQRELNGNQEPN
ncbi:MAG: AbrB/MazE/SpoVT family DNA-binding domain-containing protein [Methanobacteriota archaeon]|nr:MAG: AbrB/MazE/SpoVT family DNA-binding domain-containing protein [Euryarchaeota archaeon]